MVARGKLGTSASKCLWVRPFELADLLLLSVNDKEFADIMDEGYDGVTPADELVDDFVLHVNLTSQGHLHGLLVDPQEVDTSV